MAWGYAYPKYVPVAQRRANAMREMDRLRQKGKKIEPVEIEGRTIARSFWGTGWCEHLESFSDFENRLPRGRTYVRNGSVCHLSVKPGRIQAIVSGSELYKVTIDISRLKSGVWKGIKQRCAGQVGSMLELLQGRLSDQVMSVVTARNDGLFPLPGEIDLHCTCPDWATMCKHVAAVLYGVGSRLDTRPKQLFTLRGVDPEELIATEISLPAQGAAAGSTLQDGQLSEIFGIELDEAPAAAPSRTGTSSRARKRGAPRRESRASSKAKSKSESTAKSKTRSKSRTGSKAKSKPRVSVRAARPAGGNGEQLPRIRPTGKSVARLRRSMKLPAAEFARLLDVSAASIYRWESTAGRLNLHEKSLRALARLQKIHGSK